MRMCVIIFYFFYFYLNIYDKIVHIANVEGDNKSYIRNCKKKHYEKRMKEKQQQKKKNTYDT